MFGRLAFHIARGTHAASTVSILAIALRDGRRAMAYISLMPFPPKSTFRRLEVYAQVLISMSPAHDSLDLTIARRFFTDADVR